MELQQPKELTKSQQTEKRIRQLLRTRLEKLGSIRSGEAWKFCKDEYEYGIFLVHFNIIMTGMVLNSKADKIARGTWFIFRNSISEFVKK